MSWRNFKDLTANRAKRKGLLCQKETKKKKKKKKKIAAENGQRLVGILYII